MSQEKFTPKIAEQKANQWILKHKDGDVLYVQDAYIAAYDQAMQDFMEKACEWLSKNARNYFSAYTTSNKLIEDFKNYMEEEL